MVSSQEPTKFLRYAKIIYLSKWVYFWGRLKLVGLFAAARHENTERDGCAFAKNVGSTHRKSAIQFLGLRLSE